MVDIFPQCNVGFVDPVDVWFESFDTDDPTSAASPVDDIGGGESREEDNRGTSPSPSGKFVNPDHSSAETAGLRRQTFVSKTATFQFQTTMQPGDNFRVVGNADKFFLNDLINDDRLAGAGIADKQRIMNKWITGTFAAREIRQPDKYATNVLGVWRLLHVELDSMGPVTGNEIVTVFTDIVGTGTGLTEARGIPSINDGSADLDTDPPGNGRFENGRMIVGSGPGAVRFRRLRPTDTRVSSSPRRVSTGCRSRPSTTNHPATAR